MIMETASDDFVDITPSNSVEAAMEDPEVANVDLHDGDDNNDDQIHDQLPSVEEAKANAGLDSGESSKTRSRCWCCFYICCCLCTSFILFLILGIVVAEMQTESRSGGVKHTSTHTKNEAETLAPGTHESRFDYVKVYLETFTDEKVLNRAGSPQHQAAQWIADQDVLHLPINDETFLERYALATLYYATNGPNWQLNLGFLTEKPVCEWYHVGFGADDSPRYVGAHCQGGKKIQELFFPEKWMEGELPQELSLLKDLNYVSIYRNPGLAGEFPTAFREMTNLKYLAMHFCDVEGTLPSWLGEMTSLTSLVLSNNDLTGELPSSIAKLSHLNQLFLDDNALKGDIKMLEPLGKLEALLLEDNHFHGELDDSMIKKWQHMQILDLSNNNLTSTIPGSLWEMKNLTVLDLHTNQFTGPPLPTTIVTQKNHALSFLALNENTFTGQIPDSIGMFAKLSHLDLSSNLVTGTIPSSMEHLSHLKYLFLSINAFDEGKIPNFLRNMTKLEDLSLKATGRTGTIPHWFGELSSLILMDLDTNTLTGTVPRVLGDMEKLKFLLLNRNMLTGSIPNSFERLTNLDFLLLERNNMNGTAKHICDRDDQPQVFMADCAEIACPCCSACCQDGQTDSECDDQVWLGGVDPIWETAYERAFYKFEKVSLTKKSSN